MRLRLAGSQLCCKEVEGKVVRTMALAANHGNVVKAIGVNNAGSRLWLPLMPDRHSQRHSLSISHCHRLNLLPRPQSRQSRLLDYPYQSPLYMAPGPDPAYGTAQLY